MRLFLRGFYQCLCIFGFAVGAHSLTIPASEDSTSTTDHLTKAAGASSVLSVDAYRNSFLYFDLSDVPSDAVLRWAKLRLYLPVVRSRGSGLGVHLVTSEWNEALASAQPGISSGPLATIGPERIASKRFVTVDVTSTVQGWINGRTANEGFAIKPLSGGTAGVTSLHLPSKEGIFFGLPAELDLDFKPNFGQLPDAIQQYFSPAFAAGPSVSLSDRFIKAEVSGVGPMSYQWYKNGAAVAGGTGPALSLVGLTSGTYTLRASNSFATLSSGPVQYTAASAGPFVFIPAGSYERGNVMNEDDIYDAPKQTVTLSQYSMAVYDTTKAEWDEVRAWAASRGYTDLTHGEAKAPNHPVVSVSWYDVVKWTNAASEKDGLTPCYTLNGAVYRTQDSDNLSCNWTSNGYRLPTEAEWEVAARGGLRGKRFPWGNTISQDQANYSASPKDAYDLSSAVNDCHPTYKTGDWPFTSPVGSFAANEYGLYDMAGNVFQWCWDWSGPPADGVDPRGPSTGFFRALRGGSWRGVDNVLGGEGGAARARTARRGDDSAFRAMNEYGFRLVRSRP